jgi:undecaprenyl-diphosphatase
MLGASLLKVLKFMLEGVSATGQELLILLIGTVVSFLVSILVIKALMDYVRKRNFAAFGYYRIVLGFVVIGYFLVKALLTGV